MRAGKQLLIKTNARSHFFSHHIRQRIHGELKRCLLDLVFIGVLSGGVSIGRGGFRRLILTPLHQPDGQNGDLVKSDDAEAQGEL